MTAPAKRSRLNSPMKLLSNTKRDWKTNDGARRAELTGNYVFFIFKNKDSFVVPDNYKLKMDFLESVRDEIPQIKKNRENFELEIERDEYREFCGPERCGNRRKTDETKNGNKTHSSVFRLTDKKLSEKINGEDDLRFHRGATLEREIDNPDYVN